MSPHPTSFTQVAGRVVREHAGESNPGVPTVTTPPDPYPFPAEALRSYARSLVSTGDPPANVYQRFRDECDKAILTAAPTMSQVSFAVILGISRSTLRSMLRRLGLTHRDGRRKP